MSGDEDSFDIDIYGDDTAEETAPAPSAEPPQPEVKPAEELVKQGDNKPSTNTTNTQPTNGASPTPQQGTKRKASDIDTTSQQQAPNQSYSNEPDNRPIEAGATPALKISDLHWYTTEEDVRGMCARAYAEEELYELSFNEHKVNGKSKGEAYLEFASPQAATAVKRAIEAASQEKNESGVRKAPFNAQFTQAGNNLYKNAAVATGGKKEFSARGGGGGAYNSFNNNRGGGGRGGFQGRGGGGGYQARGGMQNQNQNQGQQGGWGMNGGGGGNMGGYGGAGFNNPMMAMGGYGNMGRGGGMMNNMGMMGNMANMMGRGGFGGMPAMGMGGMNGMNGMMGGQGGRGGMMGNGGWSANNNGNGAGGGARGGYGGGSTSPQPQGDANKRARMASFGAAAGKENVNPKAALVKVDVDSNPALGKENIDPKLKKFKTELSKIRWSLRGLRSPGQLR
ncbi:hypothetical protein LTR17_004831 [Elasticomyces elasticus]|nr:hypothetical protein LTR17_004831 [Elasticomyces elasticus]